MNNNSINIKLNLKIVCIILLVVIAGMLALWRPWQHTATTVRKLTISGTSTITATPDEFVFYPSFQRTGTDIKQLTADLNNFGTKLQADMIKLGIAENDITLDSSSYANYPMTMSSDSSSKVISLTATITAPNKALAQKVQDYLAGTDAQGQLTGQPQFSNAKQKSLEDQARLKAIADARSKATATAVTLDAKIGKVLEVTDQSSGGITPMMYGVNDAVSATSTKSLPVTAGKSDVTSTVQVTFTLQ